MGGVATDPLLPVRQAWCRTRGITGFQQLVIEAASLGHPDPAGAQKFANAVIAVAESPALAVF